MVNVYVCVEPASRLTDTHGPLPFWKPTHAGETAEQNLIATGTGGPENWGAVTSESQPPAAKASSIAANKALTLRCIIAPKEMGIQTRTHPWSGRPPSSRIIPREAYRPAIR